MGGWGFHAYEPLRIGNLAPFFSWVPSNPYPLQIWTTMIWAKCREFPALLYGQAHLSITIPCGIGQFQGSASVSFLLKTRHLQPLDLLFFFLSHPIFCPRLMSSRPYPPFQVLEVQDPFLRVPLSNKTPGKNKSQFF